MNTIKSSTQSRKPNPIHNLFPGIIGVLATLSLVIAGCNAFSHPSRLGKILQQESNPNSVIQEKLSGSSNEKLLVRMAFLSDVEESNSSTKLSEDSVAHITDRAKKEIEHRFPLIIEEVVRLEKLQQVSTMEELKRLNQQPNVEFVLLVLSSSSEITGPAQFNVAQEVSVVPGTQTENYATIEMALVDLQTGKSLVLATGQSHALLEKFDVPMGSNRYPVVKVADRYNPIFPKDVEAYEVLRIVAMGEALDQAVMHFDSAWQETLTGSNRKQS